MKMWFSPTFFGEKWIDGCWLCLYQQPSIQLLKNVRSHEFESQLSRVKECHKKLIRSYQDLQLYSISTIFTLFKRVKGELNMYCIKQNKLYKKRVIYHLSAWSSGKKLLWLITLVSLEVVDSSNNKHCYCSSNSMLYTSLV